MIDLQQEHSAFVFSFYAWSYWNNLFSKTDAGNKSEA